MQCLSKNAANAAADAATNSRTTIAMGSRSASRRGNGGLAILFDRGKARISNGGGIFARVAERAEKTKEGCEGCEGPSQVNVDTIYLRLCSDVRVQI